MAARSVYAPSQRQKWQHILRRWLPGILLVLIVLAFAVCFFVLAPSHDIADLQGAKTHCEQGKVIAFVPAIVDQSGYRADSQIVLGINGSQAFYSGTKPLLLHLQQRVQVTYRVGKSGRLYIDNVKP